MATELELKPILRQQDILSLLGISRACLWKWRMAGVFPKPMRLGPRLLGWRASDVQAWIAVREQDALR